MLLFTANDHQRVISGEIRQTFRLWKYAHVKAGRTYPASFGGRLQISEVDLMPAAVVTQEDALLAGLTSIEEVWQMAGSHTKTIVTPDTMLFRVAFTYLPELDGAPSLSDTALRDIDTVVEKLRRMDASSRGGPWTATTLRLIAEHPARRAGDLMLMANRNHLASFKADVRKLKSLGLTVSLTVGYKLSEAGQKVLECLLRAAAL
jgi:hypothetical protein